MEQTSIFNPDDLWLQTMGWNRFTESSRQKNDLVEESFWEKTAPEYTQKHNLNNNTPLIAEKIHSLLGEGKRILEIGPGSGNFTFKIAAYSKQIDGIDFSAAMIRAFQKEQQNNHMTNVSVKRGKFEEAEISEPYDYVVSVNSLYRIKDITSTLMKINRIGKDGFVIVRSLERPIFWELYKDLHLQWRWCQDYELIPLVFWENGINAKVDYVNYSVNKLFKTIEAVQNQWLGDLGKELYSIHKDDLLNAFLRKAIRQPDGFIWKVPCAAVFIYKCAVI